MTECKYLQQDSFDHLKKHEKEKKNQGISNICLKQKNNKITSAKIAQVAKEKFSRHFPMNGQCHFIENQKLCPFFEEKVWFLWFAKYNF